ncbi:MAG TPA: copper resistance protein CopC [Catenuloplanes sp.]|jgi:copper transport protein
MSRMSVDDNRPRRVARLAAATAGLLLGLLAVLVVPAGPASAHATLVRSDPTAGSVVPEPPNQVVLTFSEGIRLVPGRIQVLAPDGSRVEAGEPTLSGQAVTVPLKPVTGRGTYLVSYRVISADSHPVAGGFTYSVGAASAPPTASGNEGVDPVVLAAIPVAKYLGYAGLVLLVGPVLVLALLWPQRLSRRGPSRLVWTGMGLIVASTLATLWLQAPYTTGQGVFDAGVDDLSQVLGSTFGAVLLVRLGLLAATALLLRPLLAGKGGDGRVDLALLAVVAAVTLSTWPLTGHPSASPVGGVSVAVDVVHLAAVAVWLGGLIMLVGFLLRQAEEHELGAILPIWARWAALAVSALVLAGTIQALIEVGTPRALVSTTYGWLIVAKVALFALVMGVAAYARRLVRRQAANGRPALLRRTVIAELGITAVVLGLTAVLVQTTPARTAAAVPAAGVSGTFSTRLTSNLYVLQVDVTPAQVGNNSVHLYAYDLRNQPLKVLEWQGTAALPAQGVEPVAVPLLTILDNHSVGELRLPTPGDWQLRFTVRISEFDRATVTATVKIS